MGRIIVILSGMVVIMVVVMVAFGALMAFPVSWVWNWLLTGPESIIGVSLRTLDFWHAWGLMALCGWLVKSSSSKS